MRCGVIRCTTVYYAILRCQLVTYVTGQGRPESESERERERERESEREISRESKRESKRVSKRE